MVQANRTDYRAVFDASSSPLLVLDVDFTIVDASPAYLDVTARRRDDLKGRALFDAFPANPADPDADGVVNVNASLDRVLKTGETHSMGVQRYDIPIAGAEGEQPLFVEKYWSPVNAPIIDDDGHLIGILQEVADVTPFRDALVDLLRSYHATHPREVLDSTEDEKRERDFTDCTVAVLAEGSAHAELRTEIEQLRQALSSRSTIDHAIGIVMAERGGGPDDAFEFLATLSQHNNVKVKDIAAALVARVAGTSRQPVVQPRPRRIREHDRRVRA